MLRSTTPYSLWQEILTMQAGEYARAFLPTLFACKPSVTSDCKRQLSNRHILADSGTDRTSQ